MKYLLNIIFSFLLIWNASSAFSGIDGEDQEDTSILNLPPETLMLIFESVDDLSSLRQLRLVSRIYNSVISALFNSESFRKQHPEYIWLSRGVNFLPFRRTELSPSQLREYILENSSLGVSELDAFHSSLAHSLIYHLYVDDDALSRLASIRLAITVWNQVGEEAMDEVRAQVMDQVEAQIWAQVRYQVRVQVRDQVRDQVGLQVSDRVCGQVPGQVGDRINWLGIRKQVGAQVWAQVVDQVRAQVRVALADFDFDKDGRKKLKTALKPVIHYAFLMNQLMSLVMMLGEPKMLEIKNKIVKIFRDNGISEENARSIVQNLHLPTSDDSFIQTQLDILNHLATPQATQHGTAATSLTLAPSATNTTSTNPNRGHPIVPTRSADFERDPRALGLRPPWG